MFLIGCSTLWTERKEPAPVSESQPGGKRVTNTTPPLPLSLPLSKPVAVIVAGKLGAFLGLTDSLAERMVRPFEIFSVEEGSTESLLKNIRAMNPTNIVAIGPPALALATQLKGTDVIYAQVFNPPIGHRGVDPIPPFDMQLAYWQQISSKMERIGVLGSAVMRDVIDSLESAAAEKNIKVIRREVTSDKETLQVFRAMVPYIDGFVFLPDESVLSPDVIRRIIVHGSRNNLQILVYSPVMFDLGAHLYISAEHSDVAEQIIVLLEERDTHSRALTTMRVQVQTDTSSDDAD
ncbi:MAG: hypothetical protein O7F71_21725 [Gammaproteobacteria bacterium]|nr:hypothetical protein [Gammaproteobacteria bacterium]